MEDNNIIRVAFCLIRKQVWSGGYYYLLNLVRSLDRSAAGEIRSILFVPDDATYDEYQPFCAITSVEIVKSQLFGRTGANRRRLLTALIWGSDVRAQREFERNSVNLVFESAMFFGWRLPFPIISWLPDFQHRLMPQMFSPLEYWRRELGYRAQLSLPTRELAVSSVDARMDCQKFYPSATNQLNVCRFAINQADIDTSINSKMVRMKYGLSEKFFYLPNQYWKHKNHTLAIEALAILKQRSFSAIIVCSGNPKDLRNPGHYHALRENVKNRALQRQFIFLDLIPKEDVFALMQESEALINPSSFEGWSTTVEEAKALGVPMLLSDINVHREQASESAQFFSSPEGLASLIQDFPVRSDADRTIARRNARLASERRERIFANTFLSVAQRLVASDL